MSELAVREEHAPAVLEGTVVASPGTVTASATRVYRVACTVVRHKHTRHTARHLGYIPLGAYALARYAYTARSCAEYNRRINAATAVGDHATALLWETAKQTHLTNRHNRRMQRRAHALAAVKASPYIAGGTTALLLLIGGAMAFSNHNPRDVILPFEIVAEIVAGIVFVIGVAWGPLVIAAPYLAIAGLWYLGRQYANRPDAPQWLQAAKAAEEDGGLVLTADTIALALQHLQIPAIKTAAKDGWVPTFTTSPIRDGKGYEAEFSLPLGVTAGMLADKRPILARNLHREEVETWVTAGAPGHARLWVADRGALDGKAPEYPLLHEGRADVFKGVPVGVSPRGDQVSAPVVANNGVLGGQMGMGKSNGARVYMLGCALDPVCELNVFVFANNGDFDAFAPRLAIYRKGLEDEDIQAATERLRALYDEVGRREARLAELAAKKLTRGIAEAHADMRPIVVLFSECHELFGHDEYGKLAGELALKTIKRARKTGIVLWFDTQSSRKEAIPPAVVELVSINCCFYVKSWRSNDGFLGDGSFQSGIRATDLRPSDRGKSLITGVSSAQFELLAWHYVEVDDDTGFDAATDVIARAMKDVSAGTRVRDNVAPVEVQQRDLLDDLREVTRNDDDRVKVNDLPARLRKLAPTWAAYADMTGTGLRKALEDADIRVYTTGNVPTVEPSDISFAVAEREVSPDEAS
jgi:S-DNA-T family DNA segregation ATPase FtsK/SpoIIIE